MLKKIKVTINAPVTLGFVLLCFITTLLGSITHGKSTQLFFMTYQTSMLDPLMYIRLFSHVLGHDGWQHFWGNATYILLLGPMLEEKHGSKEIVIVILLTSFVTGVVNNIFFSSVGLCGASGVVFALILLSSFTNIKEGEIPLTFLLITILFIGGQIYKGITIQDNVSNLTHIIGGIVGAILGYKLCGKSKT